ncbi:TnsA endonuclease N-terminal domain-containing protein [Cupriavidus necator]
MARRYLDIDPGTFARLLKEGRGRGSHGTYKPWWKIHEYSSSGRRHRVSCALTGFRTHHLFSDLEYRAFLNAWWDPAVDDIREHFPMLPLAETMGIASLLQVRHPYNRKVKYPIPQQVDFLITTTGGLVAWSVMTDDAWRQQSTKDRYAIAERFWSDRDIPLRRLLGSKLPKRRGQNLEWIFDQRPMRGQARYRPGRDAALDAILDVVRRHAPCVATDVARHVETQCRLDRGKGLEAVRRLLAERWLLTDVDAGDLKQRCLISIAIGR